MVVNRAFKILVLRNRGILARNVINEVERELSITMTASFVGTNAEGGSIYILEAKGKPVPSQTIEAMWARLKEAGVGGRPRIR